MKLWYSILPTWMLNHKKNTKFTFFCHLKDFLSSMKIFLTIKCADIIKWRYLDIMTKCIPQLTWHVFQLLSNYFTNELLTIFTSFSSWWYCWNNWFHTERESFPKKSFSHPKIYLTIITIKKLLAWMNKKIC